MKKISLSAPATSPEANGHAYFNELTDHDEINQTAMATLTT